MEGVIYYIGFHKTGTSFLQNYVFNQTNLIKDFGIYNLSLLLEYKVFYNSFYESTDL